MEIRDLELCFPDDVLPEAWLAQYDNAPSILPRVPESDRMVLVQVITQEPRSDVDDTVARVALNDEALGLLLTDMQSSPDKICLWFTVPRKLVSQFLPGTD